jgi:hypothetical protein
MTTATMTIFVVAILIVGALAWTANRPSTRSARPSRSSRGTAAYGSRSRTPLFVGAARVAGAEPVRSRRSPP